MDTLQLSKRFSVRDLAAIIKQLTRKQKDRLCDLIWHDLRGIPPEHVIPEDDLKKIMDANISIKDYRSMLESRK